MKVTFNFVFEGSNSMRTQSPAVFFFSAVLLSGCGGDDPTPAETDTGVSGDTGASTETSIEDSGADTSAADTGTTDAPVDAPAAEPKATVFKLSETGHDRLFAVTFDAAGNMYAAGSIADSTAADADSSMIVAKIKPDGTLDASFGAKGIARKNVIAKKGGELARAVVVQSTGKIVIGGTVEHEGATDDRDRDLALVRFNTDGGVDDTFGTMGVQIHDLSAGEVVGTSYVADAIWDLKLATSGDGMYLFGSAKATGRTDTDFAVVKLKADGTKDTYGTGGVALIDISMKNATPKTGLVLADGTVFGSGYWTDGDSVVRPAVFKLKPDGTPDSGFGSGGIFSSAVLASVTEVYAIALQGTNIVTAGYGRASMTENLDFLSLRLTPAGVLDTSYGTMGYTRVDHAMQNDNARSVVVLPDERVLLAGGGRPTATNVDGMVAILKKDGKPDDSFGTKGVKTFDFGGASDMLWWAAVSPAKDMVAAVGVKAGVTDGNDDAVLVTVPLKK